MINKNQTIERIKALKHIEHNWDGYGGFPTTDKAIQAACKFIKEHIEVSTEQEDYVGPTPEGGISISWLNEDVILEFLPDGNYELYIERF